MPELNVAFKCRSGPICVMHLKKLIVLKLSHQVIPKIADASVTSTNKINKEQKQRTQLWKIMDQNFKFQCLHSMPLEQSFILRQMTSLPVSILAPEVVALWTLTGGREVVGFIQRLQLVPD